MNDSTETIASRQPEHRFDLMKPRRLLLSIGVLATIVTLCSAGALAAPVQNSVGKVRSVHRGLSVQPAGSQSRPGKARQPLLNAERLRTLQAQEASLGFNDGTILVMNQRTDLVLQNPELTVVKRGDVAAMDVPGSHFRIRTANAVASAIGTLFDVRIAGPSGISYGKSATTLPPGTTTVSVVSGLVNVSNYFGSVQVKAGQWTFVRPGKAPTKPTGHNARADVGWAWSMLPGG